MQSMERHRLIGAAWFAIASLVPAVTAYVRFTQYNWTSVALLLGLPMLLAAAAGAVMGPALLSGERVHSGGKAALHGLLASLMAYLVVCMGFVLIAIARSEPKPFGGVSFLLAVLQTIVLFLASSLMLVPMMYPVVFFTLFGTGALASWLLYAFRNHTAHLIVLGLLTLLPATAATLTSLPNPNNLPIYPGASNVQQGKMRVVEPSSGREERELTFETSEPFERVADYYERELTERGWHVPRECNGCLRLCDPGGSYELWIMPGSETQVGRQIHIVLSHDTAFAFPQIKGTSE